MGVHGLWDIVGPSARPVRVEALRNKRLAVDASIWIYQFLKAVRDKEGNQLKNSHIVGFLRRICKLLYFGIKPVFVFDGGVPSLKKDTIRRRKEKREGSRESVEQTAKRILAKQLQLFAEGKLTRPKASNTAATKREIPTEELYWDAYYDDQMPGTEIEPPKDIETAKEKESRMFRGQDDYDLPNHGPIKVTDDDTRVMTGYEYDRLTKDINDDLDGINLDTIDPQSKEFERLPLSTQYIALSHLRLRSRLRMGYNKEQLQSLFPDPMEFSKFQIKMVQKRNFFTQKVMNVTGMDGDVKQDVVSRRIASDKNRAYDLRRTGDGYALSISKDSLEGDSSERPIFLGDVKEFVNADDKIVELDDSDDADIDWDDVEVVKDIKVESEEKSPQPTVENPLFIKDSDGSSGESDEESMEMEDVTLKSTSEGNEPEDDDIMKKIKYLYEYSNTHNKGKGPKSAVVELSSDNDDDLDEYEEVQVQQIEDEELKQAIARSKQDYLNSLDEEKNGSDLKSTLQDEAPIILSSTTLAKTLRLPNLNMKDNLLFGKKSKDVAKKLSKLVDDPTPIEKPSTEKKKALPLPEWFSKETSFAPKKSTNANNFSNRRLTEDEKAGLVSYGDIDDYISSEEENEIINIDELSADERADKDTSENSNNNPIIVGDEPVSPNIKPVTPELQNELSVDIRDSEKLAQIDGNTSADISTKMGYENVEIKEGKNEVRDSRDESSKNQQSVAVNEERSKKISEIEQESKPIETVDHGSSTNEISGDHVNKNSSNGVDITHNDVNTFHPVSAKEIISSKRQESHGEHLDDEFEFSDEEEVNLLLDMEEENVAYDKFFSNIAGTKTDNKKGEDMWTFTDEAKLQERLRKQKRDADEVSTTMIYDVQDLLARFGIPFITAPMEAEAQCAELELIGLVDGIITDDSDCFLFGGDRVYKNLFNEKSFVECYQDADILGELGLTRSNLIELAILLGSDYTEGLKGIGKVTAMEILGEFNSLENFKLWWLDFQNGKIDESKDTPLRKKLRKSLSKTLFLGNDFPNKLIYEAYLHPEVDHDKTEFKWGHPDLDKLRTFLTLYVGWDKDKIDEILIPVIKNLNKPQLTIEEFFPVEMIQRRRQLEMSKRIKNATDKLKKGRSKQHDDDSQSKRQKV